MRIRDHKSTYVRSVALCGVVLCCMSQPNDVLHARDRRFTTVLDSRTRVRVVSVYVYVLVYICMGVWVCMCVGACVCVHVVY